MFLDVETPKKYLVFLNLLEMTKLWVQKDDSKTILSILTG